MKRSYLDYAMSVIVSRALPDARDGLKPVHRRILYAMKEEGHDYNRPYRKSAHIVGNVMGKYHPHGDSAIYDAMVRMAQDFSMRLPLIDGQGNFGSMDGDPAAAMRYTESRLAKPAHSLLADIDEDTVDFQPNYDETTREPTVLPARFPNLLVNGAGGIAVGMATNIPPHHLGELIDACGALLDRPDLTTIELMAYVPGPDFPTGGIILGRAGITSAYTTGRGSIVMRGKTAIEPMGKDRHAIIVTEIPYQVNKARMIERMAELVREKKIEGISDLRDESDRTGVRVVIEIKRDAVAEVVLNQLYKHSPLQTSFGVQMLALDGGRPDLMDLKRMLTAFLDFREEVITRRTRHRLTKARDRGHVLVGLAIAVTNLDPVIDLIRKAPDPQTARARLMETDWQVGDLGPFIDLIDDPRSQVADGVCHLTEVQARAILDLRLHRLTGLERDKIAEEMEEVASRISDFLDILSSRDRRLGILRDELAEIKAEFGQDPRRTEISDAEFEQDIEDLIQREEMVVTVSHGGYIKRVPLSTYRAQRRGGKGRTGMATREEDFVSQLFVANTHTPVLFFSSRGMVYKKKVYLLPQGSPQARGKALINLLPLEQDETISTVMPLPEDEDGWADLHVMFATLAGNVRRNLLSDFTHVMANGKIAMKLADGDRLIGVQTCTEADDILLATRQGKCIRFSVGEVRVFSGRSSTGVRGIRLAEGDEVISMSVLRHYAVETDERDAYFQRDTDADKLSDTARERRQRVGAERIADLAAHDQLILSVAEDGLGKRSSAYDYRLTRRGGKGIDNMDLKRGKGAAESRVVAAFPVEADDQVMLVTDGGQTIRSPVHDIRIAGRTTRGVTLFDVAEDERVVSVTRLGDLAETGGNGEAGPEEAAAEGIGAAGGNGAGDDGAAPASNGFDNEGAPAGED